jgi:GTPase SAR1 family protein
MIVYDITDLKSFQNIKKWINEIDKYAANDVVKIIVGNKTDLENQRTVGKDQVDEICNELGLIHIETSAKNGNGIENAFLEMTRQLKKKRFDQRQETNDDQVNLTSINSRQTIPHGLFNCCN